MDYYKLLSFEKEPFSNSPDPDLLYPSRQHRECLYQAEISVRLQRGLNVVLGEVGTGKTTVCRQLLRNLSGDEGSRVFLVLDPSFADSEGFLLHLIRLLRGKSPPQGTRSEAQLKEAVKSALLDLVERRGLLVTLLVDEAQKMEPGCLETVRELLNFETNTRKLLQVVLFAQPDFAATLRRLANLADRVNLCYTLEPLAFRDTRRLIRFRMRQAIGHGAAPPAFSPAAYLLIHRYTRGFPRRIVHLCHHLLLAAIVRNSSRVGAGLVRSCARKRELPQPGLPAARRPLSPAPALLGLTILLLLLASPLRGNLDPPPAGSNGGAKRLAQTRARLAAADVSPVAAASLGRTRGRHSAKPRKTPAAEPDGSRGILGSLRVPEGETLWNLIRTVYGVSDPEPVQDTAIPAVLRANPHLGTAHEIEAGSVLRLPALPELAAAPPAGHRIVLRTCADLETLYDLLRRERFAAQPRAVLWSKNSEKNFPRPVSEII
jgi:general secretion pathway protein A